MNERRQPTTIPDTLDSASAHADSGGLAETLSVVGDRWSLAVVASLLAAPLRFGALQGRLPAISPNVLSQRLRALESRGILVATPYSERPTRYAYELTSAGRELAGALRLLEEWGLRRLGDSAEPARHAACGSALEVRWYCPACQRAVTSPEATGEQEDEELFYA